MLVSRALIDARAVSWCVAMAALLAVSARPADAQLGKLKKIGADKIKEAAGVKPEETASGAKADFEITPERITGMMTALQPMVAAAERDASAAGLRKSHEARVANYMKCVEAAATKGTIPTPENAQKAAALTQASSTYSTRLEAATRAKRYREMALLQDSLQTASIQTSLVMLGANCGATPYKPVVLIDADVARLEQSQSGSGTQWTIASSNRMGLTLQQFGMVRERLAAYALLQAGEKGLVGNGPPFTPAEKAAMDAKGAELKKLAPFFRDGLIRWTSWSDITAW